MLTPISMSLFGKTKAGKTWFAAGAPRPVFLSASDERGWSALPSHPNWKNITILPIPRIPEMEELGGAAQPVPENYHAKAGVARDDIIGDMQAALQRVEREWKQRDWRTVVIDTASIYARNVVSQLSNYGRDQMWGKGGGQWSLVQQHIANIRNVVSRLPLHVIWLFHVDAKESDAGIVQRAPALVGKNYEVIIAPSVVICGFIEREDVMVTDAEGKPVLENGAPKIETVRGIYTKCPSYKTPPFDCGCRFEHLLPENGYMKPEWAAFAKYLAGVCKVD